MRAELGSIFLSLSCIKTAADGKQLSQKPTEQSWIL
jgi:hypothetical protein